MKEITKMLIDGLLKNPIFIIIFLIGFIGIIIINIKKLNINKSTKNNLKKTIYELKPIMTEYENNFYNILKNLENEYKIIPQLNLASIIKKQNNNKYYNELFRNIDFAIFNKDFSKILLLIELNDKTHNSIKRKDRDLKVKKICNDANIKIIFFYSKYPNEKNYVLNRILKELK